MTNKDKLKFRGQFLFSAIKNNHLLNWIEEITGSHYLYVHPDCEFSKVINDKSRLYLIGFAINPHFPEKTSQQVLVDISVFGSVEDIFSLLYPLTGRFILIIEFNNRILIFNDACGLRQVHYTKYENKLFAASQPLLLQTVVPLRKSSDADDYYSSKYVKYNKEHFLPSGITLYEDVYHLVPNHYFDSECFKQKRYWPSKALSSMILEEAVQKAAVLLKNSIYAANKRYKLALSLTSGRDSRVMLAASRDFIDNIFVYTLQYRDLTKSSADIVIPVNLSEKLGFSHNLINCKNREPEEFRGIYTGNSDMAHWEDWGQIAGGMLFKYPADRIAVRGNCVEVGRCVYFQLGRHKKIKSHKVFRRYYFGYELDFIKKRISEWYGDTSYVNELGYDIYDLFFWEHEMGGWQAQSQLEWNIIHETFAPYNNRELLDITLSVNPKLRCKPKYEFYQKLSESMWSEAMEEPVNPKSFFESSKNLIKDILILVGISTDISGLKRFISKFT